jgi:hypothetical protein
MSEQRHDVGDLRLLREMGNLTTAREDVVTRPPRGVERKDHAEPTRIKYLRIALRAVGVAFIVGIYTFTLVWPSGWSWHTGHHTPHYLQMILGVYATLGIFLLLASRNPLAHLSLISYGPKIRLLP